MAPDRVRIAGVVLSVVLLAVLARFFMLTRDPMILVFGLISIGTLWLVVLVVDTLRRGIPVRVVDDERRP